MVFIWFRLAILFVLDFLVRDFCVHIFHCFAIKLEAVSALIEERAEVFAWPLVLKYEGLAIMLHLNRLNRQLARPEPGLSEVKESLDYFQVAGVCLSRDCRRIGDRSEDGGCAREGVDLFEEKSIRQSCIVSANEVCGTNLIEIQLLQVVLYGDR